MRHILSLGRYQGISTECTHIAPVALFSWWLFLSIFPKCHKARTAFVGRLLEMQCRVLCLHQELYAKIILKKQPGPVNASETQQYVQLVEGS